MSNKVIIEVIEAVENGNAELINITVDDLKKIKGKSFKLLVEKHPELLHSFSQRLNWYELKKHGRGIRRTQKNADLFSVAEIIAAGKQIMREDGRPMIWIPVKEDDASRRAKAEWIDQESDEGQDALEAKSGRANAKSEVYEIPAIGGFDYKLGEIIQPESKTILIPRTKANAMWHAVEAEYLKSKKDTAKTGAIHDQIREWQELKAKAEKEKDKAAAFKYERLINAYRKSIESSRENGAKAANDSE